MAAGSVTPSRATGIRAVPDVSHSGWRNFFSPVCFVGRVQDLVHAGVLDGGFLTRIRWGEQRLADGRRVKVTRPKIERDLLIVRSILSEADRQEFSRDFDEAARRRGVDPEYAKRGRMPVGPYANETLSTWATFSAVTGLHIADWRKQ